MKNILVFLLLLFIINCVATNPMTDKPEIGIDKCEVKPSPYHKDSYIITLTLNIYTTSQDIYDFIYGHSKKIAENNNYYGWGTIRRTRDNSLLEGPRVHYEIKFFKNKEGYENYEDKYQHMIIH